VDGRARHYFADVDQVWRGDSEGDRLSDRFWRSFAQINGPATVGYGLLRPVRLLRFAAVPSPLWSECADRAIFIKRLEVADDLPQIAALELSPVVARPDGAWPSMAGSASKPRSPPTPTCADCVTTQIGNVGGGC
jgi:hypothetical protein